MNAKIAAELNHRAERDAYYANLSLARGYVVDEGDGTEWPTLAYSRAAGLTLALTPPASMPEAYRTALRRLATSKVKAERLAVADSFADPQNIVERWIDESGRTAFRVVGQLHPVPDMDSREFEAEELMNAYRSGRQDLVAEGYSEDEARIEWIARRAARNTGFDRRSKGVQMSARQAAFEKERKRIYMRVYRSE